MVAAGAFTRDSGLVPRALEVDVLAVNVIYIELTESEAADPYRFAEHDLHDGTGERQLLHSAAGAVQGREVQDEDWGVGGAPESREHG